MQHLRLFCKFVIPFIICNQLIYGQQEITPLPLDKLNRDSLNAIIRQKEKEKNYKDLGDIYGGMYVYFYQQTKYRDSATIFAFRTEENTYRAGDSAKYYFIKIQLGELSSLASDFKDAMPHYQTALSYYIRTENYKMLFHVYGAISGIYRAQNDTINSSKYELLAIEANKLGKDTLGEVILNNTRIHRLMDQQEIDQSIRLLNRNIWLINNAKVFGNSEQVRTFWRALQLNLIAKCYSVKKDYRAVIKFLMAGVHNDNLTEYPSAQNMLRSQLLADSYLNLNNKDSAKKYMDIFFRQAAETIETLDPEKLNEISIKYETEKKQTEIAELQQKNKVQELAVSTQRKLNIAFIIILFLLLMTAFLIIKNIAQKRKIATELAQKELLEQQQHHKEKELAMRNSITRDLHDDVGATLSSVKAYSEILKDNPDNPVIAELIRENATEMIEKLEVIAWATNPQHDNLRSLRNRMMKFATPVCHSKNIQFKIENNGLNEEMLVPGEVRQNIFLVFKESVNNMIKYAEATECKAKMLVHNNQFILQIEDNGKGADGIIKGNGSGWINMRKRTGDLKGTLDIISVIGKGTTITMSLPYPFKIPNSWDRNEDDK